MYANSRIAYIGLTNTEDDMSYLNIKDLSGPIANGHGWSTFITVTSDSAEAAMEKAREIAPDAEYSVGRVGRFGGAVLSGYSVTARLTVWLESPKYTAATERVSVDRGGIVGAVREERHFIVDHNGKEVEGAKIFRTGISARPIAWRMAYNMNLGAVA